MPDCVGCLAARGTTTKQGVGSPVAEPLALSVGPDSLDCDKVQIGSDPYFMLDDAVKWTIDFERAVSVGMGVRLPLDADDLRVGFDRLVVLGVKTSMDPQATSARLGALFDAQHYTRGLAFVKQGTPTSNTIGTPAGYPPADQNGNHSFGVERGAALDTASDCAAQMLTLALGLPRALFTHVEGPALTDPTPAHTTNPPLSSSPL